MKRTVLLFLLTTIGVYESVAQQEIPVNMYTGMPDIRVDLYTLADHDLSENFSMTYDANALAQPSDFGAGWNLAVGGSVTRVVRGLPDDFSDGTRTGWLYGTNSTDVLNFPNSADLSSLTSADETSDYNFINNLNYLKDTEPDLFSFSVGGFSGKFMFNNSRGISLIPYQDISIVPTYSGAAPGTMTITGWTITTNTGITYTFNETCSFSKALTKSGYATNGNDQAPLTLFDREYHLYNTVVNYSGSWMLSTVKSYTGAILTYTYGPSSRSTTKDEQRTAEIFDATYNTWTTRLYFNLMKESRSTTEKIVKKVTTSNGMWVEVNSEGISIYDPLRSHLKPFKIFVFSYNAQKQLTAVQEIGQCVQMAPYKFSYTTPPKDYQITGMDLWGYPQWSDIFLTKPSSNPYPTIYVYPNEPLSERYRIYPLPSSYSGAKIVLNGDGSDFTLGTSNYGTLSRIIYPSGGESDFVFGSHAYFDSRANTDQLGGGFRIESITYFDGVNPQANITKTFSYTDANGHSSGRLISRPTFAVPVWSFVTPSIAGNSGQTKSFETIYNNGAAPIDPLWRKLTMVTNFDMSGGETTYGSTVGYTQVTVTRPGSGKAVYNYYVPAAYGDASSGSGATDWSPTKMKFARSSGQDLGILRTDANWDGMTFPTYSGEWASPSFPAQYYDYERGLVWKKTEYNSNNVVVRNTLTSYQYLYKNNSQPTSIVGLAYDLFANSSPNIYLYGRYTQLADLAKVVSSETVTTTDENNSSANTTVSSQNIYNSPYHRYATQVTNTASDGTIFRTYFKYVPDYPYTGTPTDSTLWMVKLLKELNRTSTLIEKYETVQPSGGTQKTLGASLVKYRPISLNGVLTPFEKYQLAFRPSSLVTDFAASSTSGNVFTNDIRYETVNTINEYDNFGLPISSSGEDRVTSGTLWGYGQRLPVANFVNARSISIGFSDFETTTVSSFTVTNKYVGTGRTGINGVHPFATLTRTITKPSTASTYLLSFWAKPAAGNTSITLQVSLNGTAGNYQFNYKPGVTDYQYFTQAIDVSALPSTFTITIQGLNFSQPAGSSSTLLPVLDDIGFYPDYAAISSTTYDIPFGANSVTSSSGITGYTAYDSLGRVQFVYDQDHNLRQRYTYTITGQSLPSLPAVIIPPGSNSYINEPIQFTAVASTCISNIMYEWDFDNQNQFTTTGTLSPSKIYSNGGTHTVTLRVSHPDYGQKVTTRSFDVIYPPLAVSISQSNNGSFYTFTATPTNVFGAAINYQWKQRNSTDSTWTVVGTLPTYGPVKYNPGQSVYVMCTISSNDGLAPNQTVDSGSLLITN